jgi:hypothetical protein
VSLALAVLAWEAVVGFAIGIVLVLAAIAGWCIRMWEGE